MGTFLLPLLIYLAYTSVLFGMDGATLSSPESLTHQWLACARTIEQAACFKALPTDVKCKIAKLCALPIPIIVRDPKQYYTSATKDTCKGLIFDGLNKTIVCKTTLYLPINTFTYRSPLSHIVSHDDMGKEHNATLWTIPFSTSTKIMPSHCRNAIICVKGLTEYQAAWIDGSQRVGQQRDLGLGRLFLHSTLPYCAFRSLIDPATYNHTIKIYKTDFLYEERNYHNQAELDKYNLIDTITVDNPKHVHGDIIWHPSLLRLLYKSKDTEIIDYDVTGRKTLNTFKTETTCEAKHLTYHPYKDEKLINFDFYPSRCIFCFGESLYSSITVDCIVGCHENFLILEYQKNATSFFGLYDPQENCLYRIDVLMNQEVCFDHRNVTCAVVPSGGGGCKTSEAHIFSITGHHDLSADFSLADLMCQFAIRDAQSDEDYRLLSTPRHYNYITQACAHDKGLDAWIKNRAIPVS